MTEHTGWKAKSKTKININRSTMGALLRYQMFLGIGVLFLSIWYAGLQTSPENPMVLYAPVWAVLLLGIYAVGSIAIGLANFKDFPEAAAEIDRQVQEAKAEMKKRGIIKD